MFVLNELPYMKRHLLCPLLVASVTVFGQVPDSIYVHNVKTVQLYMYGNQLATPIIRLGSSDRMELHFDDLDANVKNYFYTYQLCNADWTPADVGQFDYIRGFPQTKIGAYRFSSIALTKYTHYQAIVPDVNCVPTLSGNYMLKVYLDDDTSKLAFTRRFLVTEDGAAIGAQFLEPFNPQIAYTHQKLQFTVNTRSLPLTNAFQQVKVVLMQNDRWDNAVILTRPSFFSGTTFQYNSDDCCVFPAGKQWRWIDLQSFHFQSDRILHADYQKSSTSIILKPDVDRSGQGYVFYNDINGQFFIQTTESINPLWQTDYATVHFSFVPYRNEAFKDKDVYLLGKFTDYALTDSLKMNFNVVRGMYETSVLMKQGNYDYMYVTVDREDSSRKTSFEWTEGNNIETENDYSILVYYRPLGGRTDQLIGLVHLNSLRAKGGN
jgi:hypothetical protein